jgi:hypothetical protein
MDSPQDGDVPCHLSASGNRQNPPLAMMARPNIEDKPCSRPFDGVRVIGSDPLEWVLEFYAKRIKK